MQHGPAVRRRKLGAELRALRTSAGLTSGEAAGLVGWHQSKVSRIETGTSGAKPADVRLLLDAYGAADDRLRELLLALAGAAVRVRTTTAGSQARISCFGISDHPVTRDVSHQLRSALDATGADPGEPDLRRALADHADGIADDVVDTGGDAHASAAYRRQLIAGLVSRQVARAYLRSVRSTRKGESS